MKIALPQPSRRRPQLDRGGQGASRSVGILISCLCGLPFTSLGAQDVKFSADFEGQAYQLGSIHGQQGWSVEQGVAAVTAGAGRNGSAGLVLLPASPFSQATLRLSAAAASTSSCFLDFYVAPAATAELASEEMLDIDSARIGFFRSPAQPTKGTFWIFNGDGAGGGTWQATRAELPVDAVTGRPAEWVRITLREDFAAQSWDFWVNGQLAASSAGFQEPTGNQTGSYVILGDAVERLVLDDLTIGGPNPLGVDTDADGMLDLDEVRIGSNPAVADRLALDSNSIPFGEKWAALPLPSPVVVQALPPVFSKRSGVAHEPFTLTLASAGSTAVYYTLDGSAPTPSSGSQYSVPLMINSTTVIRTCAVHPDGVVSASASAAWVFPDQVVSQVAPANWPEAFLQQDPATGGTRQFPLDVEMQAALEGQVSEQSVATSFEQAPIVVLTTPMDQLFGPSGIYEQSGSASHKALADVIWMDARSGAAGGAGGVTVKVSGQSSRSHAVTMKHSLRLTLSKVADAGPVFGTGSFPTTQFLLRHPTSDSWAVTSGGDTARKAAKYVTDAWASQWLAARNRPALRHQWVHVFLNGVYWGVYDAVEQHDAVYSARHPQAGPERRLAEPAPEIGLGAVRSILGSVAGWGTLGKRLRQLAGEGALTPDEAWQQATALLDTDGLIDYMLWHWWLQPQDWPQKNWLASWEGGKWRVLQWDGELSLPDPSPDLVPVSRSVMADQGGPAAVFAALSFWAPFRQKVADRFEVLSAQGNALAPASLIAGLSQAAGELAPLLAAESARWGGAYSNPPLTPLDWQAALNRVSISYLSSRTAAMKVELEAWLGHQASASHRNPPPDELAGITPPASGSGNGFPSSDWPLLDSDGDGLPDFWERLMGLNPFDATDAMSDGDGDGKSNLEEFLKKSNPRHRDPRPAVSVDPPGLHNAFAIPPRRRVQPITPLAPVTR